MQTIAKIIDEKTLIPLGVVAALLGGIGWLTALNADTQTIAKSQLRIEAKQDKLETLTYEELKVINQRLSTMEGLLRAKER